MAEKIRKRVKEQLRLNASIGIANSKVVAKIASELSKPDGLIEVSPGEEGPFLAPLPIGKLPGIGKKTERILMGLSIDTIGKLHQMPPTALKSYFGASGKVLQSFSRGIDDSKVELPPEAKSISRETTFNEDTHDRALPPSRPAGHCG